MTISQIRSVIDTASWNRHDLSGSTREEFMRCDVPRRLLPQIEALRALTIHPRFTSDIERRDSEIPRCETVIERWVSLKTADTLSKAVN